MTKQNEVDELLQLVRIKSYRKIVFDLDETLTILNLPWQEWIDEVAQMLPEKRVAEFLTTVEGQGRPWGAVINEQIAEVPTFYDRFLAVCAAFEQKYFSHTPYQALVDALPALKGEDRQFYIWTANTRATVERALREMGIRDLFDGIVAREDVRYGKPDKEAWQHILEFDEDLTGVLLVGDSKNDEASARAAGIAFFKITHFK